MSGPKVSIYSLTPAQIAAIHKAVEQERLHQEQLKAELKEKKRISKSITTKLERITKLKDYINSFSNISEQSKEWTGDDELEKRIKKGLQLINHIQSNALKVTEDSDLSKLSDTLDFITNHEKILDETIETILQKSNHQRNLIDEELNDAVYSGFIELNSDNITQDDQRIIETKARYYSKINESKDILGDLHPELSTKLNKTKIIINSNNSLEFLENYFSIELKPLLNQVKDAVEFDKKYKNKYEQLLTKYEVLREELNKKDQTQVFAYNDEGILLLEQAVSKLEIEANRKAETEYITDSINDVMIEMGYNNIGERHIQKKSGKKYNSELYDYGNGTAVNITYGSDGKISMELGKLDVKDRIPDNEEKASLVNAMETFCLNFNEIENRLLSRGVKVSDRISMMPPEEAFAQIINTTDYHIISSSESKETNKRKEQIIKKETIKNNE